MSSHIDNSARKDAQLVPHFTEALESYQRSNKPFQVLSTSNLKSVIVSPAGPKTLLVLDSSFNPPTQAHKRMALSALFDGSNNDRNEQSRILLLLAINNADKAPKPAAFPQRLAMMRVFGDELLSEIAAADPRGYKYKCAGVDVGVTTEPYFHAKAAAVGESDFYRAHVSEGEKDAQVEQVYLTGFDTLIRIFNPKYYADNFMAQALDPFFARARLRVTTRAGDSWGDEAAQRKYLEELKNGELERVGGKTAWAERVEMVDGGQGGDKVVVSSTKVREAVLKGDWDELEKLVSKGVAEWIRDQELYAEASK